MNIYPSSARIVLFALLTVGCSPRQPDPTILPRYTEAKAHYYKNRLEMALPLLESIHAQDPAFSGASFLLGRIAFFKNDYSRAEEYWSRTLDHNPHHIDTRKWLARLHLLQESPDLAVQTIVPAMIDSAEDPELLLLMAKARRDQGDVGEAIEFYTKAQVFGTRLAEASLDLAEIYQQFGLTNRSREELRRALDWVGAESPLAPPIRALLDPHQEEDTE